LKILKDIARMLLVLFLIPVLYVAGICKRVRRFRGALEKDHAWYRLKIPGMVDSRGKPVPLLAKRGTQDKLLVFLSGGGACWNEETAARPMRFRGYMTGENMYYFPSYHVYLDAFLSGIAAADDSRNPFNDWNAVYLPYATGDLHLGDSVFDYRDRKGRARRLHFAGTPNIRAAMERAAELFPGTKELLIAGDSAGAFGVAGQAPLIASCFPDASRVHVYSDAAMIRGKRWEQVLRDVWKADPDFGKYLGEEGDLIYSLVRNSSEKLPDARFLRSNTPRDEVLTPFENKFQGGEYTADRATAALFEKNFRDCERRFGESGLPQRRYVCVCGKQNREGLTQHTMARNPKSFFGTTHGDDSLAGWLADAVLRGQYRDVGNDLLEGEE